MWSAAAERSNDDWRASLSLAMSAQRESRKSKRDACAPFQSVVAVPTSQDSAGALQIVPVSSLRLSGRGHLGMKQTAAVGWTDCGHSGHHCLIGFIQINCGRAPHQRKQLFRFHTAPDLLVLPLTFTQRHRRKEIQRPANAAAVVCLEMPQVNSNAFTKRGQIHQAVEVTVAVTPAPGACELQRLAPIRF